MVAAGVAPSIFVPRQARGGSKELKILVWSHFVPRFDKEWYDGFAKKWGEANGIAVTVDHIGLGSYRKSLWEKGGKAGGPETWEDLITIGGKIKKDQGIQLGIGLSQELDSNMAARALLWSYDSSIQDAEENVVLNNPKTLEAVDFMARLYKESMVPEVFAWTDVSNNQALIAGRASYILNSISAYRSAQKEIPEIAKDIEEQAMIDGLSRFGAMFKVVLPLAISGILTVVVFAFTLSMHEFISVLTFISVSAKKTVSIGVPIELVRGDVFQWGPLMAGALVASIPVAVVYTFFLDRFVAGFTMGSVK